VNEHHLSVSRSARYYTLGQTGPSLREAWFLCHGYSELARPFLRRFESLDDGTRLLVAPEALSRFYLDTKTGQYPRRIGASWMTREDRQREIADYLGYLDALYDQCREAWGDRSVTIRVLGFSQGAATAARWAVHGRVVPAELVIYGGVLPPDILPHELRSLRPALRILLVGGDRDELLDHTELAKQAAALEAAGVDSRLIRFEGGHRIEPAVLQQLG
jgi:predicted esterase